MKRDDVARRLRTLIADIDEISDGEPECLGPALLQELDDMRDDLVAIAQDLDGQGEEPEEVTVAE